MFPSIERSSYQTNRVFLGRIGGTFFACAASGFIFYRGGGIAAAALGGGLILAGTFFAFRESLLAKMEYVVDAWRGAADSLSAIVDKVMEEDVGGHENREHTLLTNLALLHVTDLAASGDKTAAGTPSSSTWPHVLGHRIKRSLGLQRALDQVRESEKFMRFSSAAYGAALLTMLGLEAPCASDRAAFCAHSSIEDEDLLLEELQGEDPETPRHAVALDRAGRNVVIVIRGTCNISDIIVHDLVCAATPFCGGSAHKGIALAAKAVATSVTSTVLAALADNPGFSVVVCGHSLGAGTACLLTMLLLEDLQRPASRLPKDTEIRCFAFAPPPVYAPVENAPPGTTQAIVAFRHAADAVPKLSLLSVRHLIQAVRRIDELPLKRSTRYRAILGLARKVPGALATAVAQRPTMAELETDEGPLLVIPTRNIICLTPASGSGKLEASSASSNKQKKNLYRAFTRDAGEFAAEGIDVMPRMFPLDHLNHKYEQAFRGLIDRLETDLDNVTSSRE
eukprot:g4579.t1